MKQKIRATRDWLDSYSKRGPASASFARFMEDSGLVTIVEKPCVKE